MSVRLVSFITGSKVWWRIIGRVHIVQHLFYITGFMGSGKTTIGQAIGRKFNYQVVDIDQWIEEKEQRIIKDIFQTQGETYFRELETEALQTISGDRLIVTTGGGIVVNECNRQIMSEQGTVIYLKCEMEELFRRLEGDTSRPNFHGHDKKQVEQLFHKRQAYYEQADITIDTTNKSVIQICNELKDVLNS
ncbi:shikimate kinase [bacterium LRH843]|nr:shikimate kinase [bacterium LRH843]